MKKHYILLIIIYLAFIGIGLPEGIMGVAWPSIHRQMGVPVNSLSYITTISVIFGALSCFNSNKLIKKIGVPKVVLLGCLLVSLSVFLYAYTKSFVVLFILTIPFGFGIGAIDTGLNNYVAENYRASHMNFLHCFWGLGASLGTFMVTIFITSSTWQNGFRIIGIMQLLITFIVFLSISFNLWSKKPTIVKTSKLKTQKKLHKKKYQFLSATVFFLYTGLEYGFSMWIATYLYEFKGFSIQEAGFIASSYYFFIMTGRIFSGLIVHKFGNNRMLQYGFTISFVGLFVLSSSPNFAFTFIGIGLLGVGISPICPCLIHETPKRYELKISRKLIGYQTGAAELGCGVTSILLGYFISHNHLLFFPCLMVYLLLIVIFDRIIISQYRKINRKPFTKTPFPTV